MSDAGDQTSDQTTPAEVETPAQTIEPAEPVTESAEVTQTGGSSRGNGWFKRSVRNGIIAAVIIVVAGVFFTIGWFTSTRGEHERCGVVDRVAEQMNKPQWNVPQSGANQQGSDQWQGRPGGGWGMGPSQHEQGQDQTVPKGESQSGGSSTQQAPSTEQGYLGVWLETVTPELQEQHGLSSSNGALIATIDGSGPARQAGIRRGDVIISIDGTSVTQQEDVVDLITQRQAGESVSVTVDRKGQSLTFRVTLAERPASVSG